MLVGDAAYAVSLLAGQGASLGIAGAFVLAEHLRRADSIKAGLDQYEQAWRPVVEEKQQAACRTARWFLPHSRAERQIRRRTVALSRLPGLNRLLAGSLAGKPTTLIRELHQPSIMDSEHSWR